MPQATAGHYTRLAYLWEDNGFRADPADTDMKPFGIDTQLSTKEGANNAVRLFNPDDPRAQQIIEQNFAGTFTVEFTLTNPWWLRAVIGESSDDGNANEVDESDTCDGRLTLAKELGHRDGIGTATGRLREHRERQ